MQVPFVNLGLEYNGLQKEIHLAIDRILSNGQFVFGREVSMFEESFASRVECKYAIGVNSGTDALFLVLRALGIKEGDEVITVSNTYIATAAAIALNGAKPQFVDVTPDENMDVNAIEKHITSRTKAIIPVHLRGRPVAMGPLMEIARSHKLLIVEDCAQAVDAMYYKQKVGSFGIAGGFSFHPLKNLGSCGDAGIITTNDESLYQELKQLHNHGLQSSDFTKNPCVRWGFNSRLDSIAAAVLSIKLRYLDQWTERRRLLAQEYIERLTDLPIALPFEKDGEHCVYNLFVIQTLPRDELKDFLLKRQIETKIQWPVPLHLQPVAKNLGYREGDFPIVEQQNKMILSLPLYPGLSKRQINHVISSIRAFFS